MNTLKIQQNNTIEQVSASIIKKLYDLAITIPEPLEGEEDAASLTGHIQLPVTYKEYVDYLAGTIGEGDTGAVTSVRQNPEGRFQQLRIDVTNSYAIPFEDTNMLQYLLSLGIGSNGLITMYQAANVSVVANSQNTTATKFNELKYFTNITNSKSGFSGNQSGNISFYNWTALEEVDISNFTSLGHNNGYAYEDTFGECTSLEKVIASSKLTNIGYRAFYKCSNLEYITDLAGTINVYGQAFFNCQKLKSSNFDNCLINLQEVSSSATSYFQKCNTLTHISITGTTIPSAAFRECSNLTTINGLSEITTIKGEAFREANLSNVNAETDLVNVETISAHETFYLSNLFGNLYMPKLTTITDLIYSAMFKNCGNLTKILCLGKINLIPSSAFTACDSLQEAYIPYECTEIKSSAFKKGSTASLTTIKQYNKSIDSYQEGESPIFNPISRVTIFGDECFSGQSNLSLTASDIQNATYIGNSAFNEVNISGNLQLTLTNLGSGAFQNTNISSVDLTNSTIATAQGFRDCTNLTSVTLPYTIITINNSAFKNDTNLTTINFPNNITSIGNNAFDGCTSLSKKINLPNLTSIGRAAFRGSAITEVEDLGQITYINGSANFEGTFRDCTNLTKVVLPSTCVGLYSYAFSGCTSLTDINLNYIEEVNTKSLLQVPGPSIWNLANLTTVNNASSALAGYSGKSSSFQMYRRQMYTPKLKSSGDYGFYSNYASHDGCFENIQTDLMYFKDIESFCSFSFIYVTCINLVINNTTPPQWIPSHGNNTQYDEQHVFDYATITNIYVPDSAVTTYTTDTNWSTVASLIKPISQLTVVATEADLAQNQIALIKDYCDDPTLTVTIV